MPEPVTAVEILDQILQQAIAHRASDIHFECQEDGLLVRFRIDGLLHFSNPAPRPLKDAILSRLKVLASMDIAEKRLPQDGRFRYAHQSHNVDMRVSSLPTTQGEKLVVRLLHYTQERPTLSSLGYSDKDQTRLNQALNKPHGLILITGPTGSGKTLSIYSCLDLLNTPERNISTVEDPVEIHMPGINQVQINERAGLTFATSLRALLRQDPDILVVGEIRDRETAEIAMQAAQTGHLVLSTLHTNDAPSTLTRLHHMGVAAFNVAASVTLITAQRLARCLCTECKTPMSDEQLQAWQQLLTPEDWRIASEYGLANERPFRSVGCNACRNGYNGRVGLYQVMAVSTAMQSLILRDPNSQALATLAAKEGALTLRQAGWLKVLQGITSVEEVMAMTTHA